MMYGPILNSFSKELGDNIKSVLTQTWYSRYHHVLEFISVFEVVFRVIKKLPQICQLTFLLKGETLQV